MTLALIGHIFSFLGDPRIWIALSITLFAARMFYRSKKQKRLMWVKAFIIFVGVSMGLAFLTTTILKDVFEITRPCSTNPLNSNYNEYCLDNYSFPSGHSTTGFAAATGLFLLLRKKKWSPLIFLIGILTAYGRVLLGVHTVADVAAGAAVGIVFSYLFCKLVKFSK